MSKLMHHKKTAKSNANAFIDELIHPYFKENPTFIFLDGFLHAIVEQNPDESLIKFLRYNVPELQRYLANKRKKIALDRKKEP